MPEVCSSGLSHTHADYFPAPHGNFPFVTDNAVLDSEIFMDLNYGVLDVKKAKKDAEIVLKASIRDIDGYEVISKEYKKQDFVFDAENLLNSELCFARAAKQLNFKIMSQNFTKIFFDYRHRYDNKSLWGDSWICGSVFGPFHTGKCFLTAVMQD